MGIEGQVSFSHPTGRAPLAMKFASGALLFCSLWHKRECGRALRFLTCIFGRLPSKTLKLVGDFFAFHLRGGCSYSSAKRDSSFRWAFLAALAQARPGLRPPPEVLRPTVLESRPSSAQHSVVGPPVEMTQPAAPRGSAELQAMRRMTAAEAHRRLASGCNGHGKWQALAGGRHWQVAGIGEALGWASLSKGQAVERRSCDAAARAGGPAAGAGPPEGGKIRAPCMI